MFSHLPCTSHREEVAARSGEQLYSAAVPSTGRQSQHLQESIHAMLLFSDKRLAAAAEKHITSSSSLPEFSFSSRLVRSQGRGRQIVLGCDKSSAPTGWRGPHFTPSGETHEVTVSV